MMGERLDGEVARARIELEIVLDVLIFNSILIFRRTCEQCFSLQNLPTQSYCVYIRTIVWFLGCCVVARLFLGG